MVDVKRRFLKTVLSFSIVWLSLLVLSCSSVPPRDVNNLCSIVKQKRGWYHNLHRTYKKWGVPIHVQAAIIHQESRFKATAKPPRKKILGLIPGPRPSSAFGYAQALDDTWLWYQEKTGRSFASRKSFADATDFIGWYTNISHKRNGLSKWDAYNLYLAYHEGHGGFERKTYLKKPWLINVAKKVNRRAKTFRHQLKTCPVRRKA